MGGCPSADTVRHDVDDAHPSNRAVAATGSTRQLLTHGGNQSRPHTPLMHQGGRGGGEGTNQPPPATPHLGMPRPTLSIQAPVTPDVGNPPQGSARTRLQQPHPDIVLLDPSVVSNPAKYLELERARISIPQTPKLPRDIELYKYFCPICMLYFKEIFETNCCKNYVCVLCALAHVKTRAKDPTVDSWYTLPTEETIDGVNCPTCNSDEVQFHAVLSTDKTRSYQESPHTKGLFAAMEARKQMGVNVSGLHLTTLHAHGSSASDKPSGRASNMSISHRPSSRSRNAAPTGGMGGQNATVAAAAAAVEVEHSRNSASGVRDHPVAELRRHSHSENNRGLGSASVSFAPLGSINNAPFQPDHPFQQPHEEVEIEHEEDSSNAGQTPTGPPANGSAYALAPPSHPSASSSATTPQPYDPTSSPAMIHLVNSNPSPLVSMEPEIVLGYSAAAAGAAASASAASSSTRPQSRHPSGAPTRPPTNPTALAASVAKMHAQQTQQPPTASSASARPDSAPGARSSASGPLAVVAPVDASEDTHEAETSSTIIPDRRVQTPTHDAQGRLLPIPPAESSASANGNIASGVSSADRRSSGGARLGSSHGWSASADESKEESEKKPVVSVIRVTPTGNDEEQKHNSAPLFYPSPVAPSVNAVATPTGMSSPGGSVTQRILISNNSLSVLGPPTAVASPAAATKTPTGDESQIALVSAVHSHGGVSNNQQLVVPNDMVEQSFSFDQSNASFDASNDNLNQHAAVHPMPSN